MVGLALVESVYVLPTWSRTVRLVGEHAALQDALGVASTPRTDDLVRPVHEVGRRLGYVHVGDNHRGYLRSGHLDFSAFLHALVDIRNTGPVTFESFSSAVLAAGLSSDLAVWRSLWSDSDELARHARSFISNHLTTSSAS